MMLASSPAAGGTLADTSISTCEPRITGQLRLTLLLFDKEGRFWNPARELRVLEQSTGIEHLPALAQRMRLALAPVGQRQLNRRLEMLGKAMAPNRGPEEAGAWLVHMMRGLGDLPEDILVHAIDEHVRSSKFLPTVQELREIAEPLVADRRLAAKRLEELAGLLDGSFVPAPRVEYRPDANHCTQEEAKAILKEVGLENFGSGPAPAPRAPTDQWREEMRHRGTPRKPTRADYLALGVAPETLDSMGIAA
jgi:hypothetical protein